MEYMFIARQGPNMKAIGKTICSTDLAFKFTRTAINMRECSNMAREMERALITTPQERFTKVNGITEKFKALEFVLGKMAKNMKANGKTTKNMDKGLTRGRTHEGTKVTIAMIKNMGQGPTFGPTGENIWDNGKMTKDMGEANMSSTVILQNKGFGKKIRESNGLIRTKIEEKRMFFMSIKRINHFICKLQCCLKSQDRKLPHIRLSDREKGSNCIRLRYVLFLPTEFHF